MVYASQEIEQEKAGQAANEPFPIFLRLDEQDTRLVQDEGQLRLYIGGVLQAACFISRMRLLPDMTQIKL